MLEDAKKLVKPIKICYIIALIVWIFNIGVFFYNIRSNIDELLVFANAFRFIFICLIGTVGIMNGINIEKTFDNYLLIKNFSLQHSRKLGVLGLFIWFISSNVLVIVPVIAGLKIGNEILSTLTFPGLPCLIGNILFIVLICMVLIQEKIESKDYDEEQKQKKQLNKNVKRVIFLLGKVGSKFFIKYYHPLKVNSVIDIMDIIEEQYSESTKKSRILHAKTIFAENLQKLALHQILNDTNTILDEEMLNIARSLFNNEQ